MSIARACYVRCNLCGSPGPISTGNAADARAYAVQQGFKRVLDKDYCPRHVRYIKNGSWIISPVELPVHLAWYEHGGVYCHGCHAIFVDPTDHPTCEGF